MTDNWNQAICDHCWYSYHGYRHPVRMKNPDTERCNYCNCRTNSGIYVRQDPKTVPYPTKKG